MGWYVGLWVITYLKTIVVTFFRSAYRRLKEQNHEEIDSEFVQVLSDLKPHVIGIGGRFVKEIMIKSGAKITSEKEDEGFTVRGDADQRACAKNLILEKVVSMQSKLYCTFTQSIADSFLAWVGAE